MERWCGRAQTRKKESAGKRVGGDYLRDASMEQYLGGGACAREKGGNVHGKQAFKAVERGMRMGELGAANRR